MLLIGALATITALVSVLALLVLAVTRLANAVRKLMEATGLGRQKKQAKTPLLLLAKCDNPFVVVR